MLDRSENLTPEVFVQKLAEIQLENVFNPYAQICARYDKEDAVSRRCVNLTLSLHKAIDLNVRTIWIARDLGYRGGRRTGLALTDEAHLKSYSALLDGVPVTRATTGPEVGERTANTIWRMLERIGEPIFLWNVFPLHPHEEGDPMSNRCHTSKERKACAQFLHNLIAMLNPEKIVAIGGDAHKAAGDLGINTIKVRHPSYGGQSDFIRQISHAYKIERSCDQLDMFETQYLQ